MPKRILILIDWYEPGYRAGGPIRSIVNLCAQLSDHSFKIITSNTDHSSTEPYSLSTKTWHKHSANSEVMYLGENDKVEVALEKCLQSFQPDFVYINSLFSAKFALAPLKWLRKNAPSQQVVLAPRGMLKAGALSVKPLKKKLFLKVSKGLGWFKNIRWHATNHAEAQEIRWHYSAKSEIMVAPNLCALHENTPLLPKKPNELQLIMVARVSEEKGVLEGIEYLKNINPALDLALDIYGPMQDAAYAEQCKKAIKSIPHFDIELKGEIEPKELNELWKKYHFLYSTTKGENYGHSIVEALLHGKPVLISNRTPWRELEQKNAGYDVELSEEQFALKLEQIAALPHEDYTKLCRGAENLGQSIANDEEALQAVKQLFIL